MTLACAFRALQEGTLASTTSAAMPQPHCDEEFGITSKAPLFTSPPPPSQDAEEEASPATSNEAMEESNSTGSISTAAMLPMPNGDAAHVTMASEPASEAPLVAAASAHEDEDDEDDAEADVRMQPAVNEEEEEEANNDDDEQEDDEAMDDGGDAAPDDEAMKTEAIAHAAPSSDEPPKATTPYAMAHEANNSVPPATADDADEQQEMHMGDEAPAAKTEELAPECTGASADMSATAPAAAAHAPAAAAHGPPSPPKLAPTNSGVFAASLLLNAGGYQPPAQLPAQPPASHSPTERSAVPPGLSSPSGGLPCLVPPCVSHLIRGATPPAHMGGAACPPPAAALGAPFGGAGLLPASVAHPPGGHPHDPPPALRSAPEDTCAAHGGGPSAAGTAAPRAIGGAVVGGVAAPAPAPAMPPPAAEPDDDGVAALLLGFGARASHHQASAAACPAPAASASTTHHHPPSVSRPRAATPPVPLVEQSCSGGAELLFQLSPGASSGRDKGRGGRGGRPAGGRPAVAAPAHTMNGDNGDDEEDDDDDDDDDDGGRVRAGAGDGRGGRGRGAAARAPGDDDDGDVIDLGRVPVKQAIGSRLQVSYMERQGRSLNSVPYRGVVVSVDMRRGLRVKLDGYVRREWVTDEDEWTWLSEHDSAPLPHQLELMAAMADPAPAPVGRPPKGSGGGGVAGGSSAAASSSTGRQPVGRPPNADRVPPLARAPGAAVASQQPAFVAASLVRLRLRGERMMELPRSLTDKPRRSSHVRPLPGLYLGAAAEAKDEAYDDRIAAEKAARKITKEPKPERREERTADAPGGRPSTHNPDEGGEEGAEAMVSPRKGGKAAAKVGRPPKEDRAADGKGGGAKGGGGKGGGSKGGGGKGGGGELNGKDNGSGSVDGTGDDDALANGVSAEAKVTISAGPHAGVEAKVLHVGNGWVKLQLPSGSVVHLRKWDLVGTIPLKLRSPTKMGKPANGSGKEAFTDGGGDASDGAAGGKEQSAAAGNRRGRSGGDADGAAESAVAADADEAAAGEEKATKPRKRPPEPLGDGLCVGAAVFARLSGIKFQRGTIAKILTSSKWVLITFDDDTNQWVTSRELVRDAQPSAAELVEGSEVIAAWEDEPIFYKGIIIGITPGGRYRVRYDDWDDALVQIEGVRLLPETYGRKKKKVEPAKEAKDAAANGASKAAQGDGGGSSGARDANKPASDSAPAPPPAPPSAPSAPASGEARLASFVRMAREQLLTADPERFQTLTMLLARAGTLTGEAASTPADCALDAQQRLEAELVTLLADHPTLLRALRGLIGSTPRAAPPPAAREEAAERRTPADVDAPGLPPPPAAPPAAPPPREAPREREGGGARSGGAGKGVRELHKLLGEFDKGTLVGVEIGSKTRRRDAGGGGGEGAAPSQPPTPMEVAPASAPPTSGVGSMAMPLKKRHREVA